MRHESLDEHWAYNCEDTVRTLECAEVETDMLAQMGLTEPNAAQQAMFYPVLDAMIRGVRIDLAARARMAGTLLEELTKREQYFLSILGHPLNPASPKQMKALFYDDLRQKIIINRKTGQPTLDDDALETLGTREPILRPLLRRIAEYRSLGVFLATFVNAPLDSDERMRCSYNICGTETYRLASRKNAFGSGTNLQNVPKGGDEEGLELPNIRSLFIPDPGYTFFDMDLERADLYVVVWESDDQELKHMLRSGIDVHTENAKVVGMPRQEAKKWVHGTNYGGSPRTMAINCGITVKQAESMQRKWFEAHPGILKWHQRTESQLRTRHFVENKYGYRRFYFDRVEALLPEALAWIPQSTVALHINRIWLRIFTSLRDVQVLLQVHDSLAGQFPTKGSPTYVPQLRDLAQLAVPYSDPLVIPVNIKTSTASWGACE